MKKVISSVERSIGSVLVVMLINIADAEAESKKFEGKANAYESIGDTGCPIDPDPACKPGEPCRVGLVLEGNVAARLYDILARQPAMV